MRFAITTVPEPTRSQVAVRVSMVLAGIFVVMALAQLFALDKFQTLLIDFDLGGQRFAVILSALLPVCEVFALPFLLRMYVSPLMRAMSLACGWFAVIAWLYISVATTILRSAHDAGFLGGAVSLPAGWCSVAVAVVLVLLMTWASWGMWPMLKKKS